MAKLEEFPFGDPGLSVLGLRDPAENPECVHGRLPLDTSPPCGCWPIERRLVIKGKPGYRAKAAVVGSGPLCLCGCGERTSGGQSRGRPVRFVAGHNFRAHMRTAA